MMMITDYLISAPLPLSCIIKSTSTKLRRPAAASVIIMLVWQLSLTHVCMTCSPCYCKWQRRGRGPRPSTVGTVYYRWSIMMKLGDAGSTRPLHHITRCLTVEADNVTYQSSPGLVSGTLHLLTSPHSSMTTRLFSTRIVPDLFFPIRPEPDFARFGMTNPTGAGFSNWLLFY